MTVCRENYDHENKMLVFSNDVIYNELIRSRRSGVDMNNEKENGKTKDEKKMNGKK